ncbi:MULTISPECIES: hypothetical protein [Frankiaceae]|nr:MULTISPECIES: hypothetical protein [Frankiaceae]
MDSTELASLFSEVTDLLSEREELLGRLHAAGITVTNARIAAHG